jgi:HEAT repeat protein
VTADDVFALVVGPPRRGGRRAALAVIACTGAPDPADRQAALHALGMVEPRRRSTQRLITRTLLAHLADPDEAPAVRGEAAEQLGCWWPGSGELRRDVVANLLAGLDDPAPDVRFWCAYALGTLRVRRAIPRLRELVGDPAVADQFWSVGEEAVWAIMTILHGSWPTPMEPEYVRLVELPPLARHELSARRGRAPAPRI